MSGVNPVAVSANPFQFGAGSIQKLIEKENQVLTSMVAHSKAIA